MSRDIDHDDEWTEDEDSSDDLMECPSCRREVHEDTQQCPHCGDWIEPVYPGERRKRRWWIVAVALLILSWILVVVLRLS